MQENGCSHIYPVFLVIKKKQKKTKNGPISNKVDILTRKRHKEKLAGCVLTSSPCLLFKIKAENNTHLDEDEDDSQWYESDDEYRCAVEDEDESDKDRRHG